MAIGTNTFNFASGAVGDIFAGFGHSAKAKGLAFERENYLKAAQYADKNAQYTEMSTRIKEAQSDRELSKSLGETQADVAGAGFAESGSALDILRDSASQGALAHAVLQEQGLITEEGYKVQAESYRNMAKAAEVAISAEKTASIGSFITGGIKGLTALATL